MNRIQPTIPYLAIPYPGQYCQILHHTCKLDRPRLRLMQTQVPPAPMATYASFPPAPMPQNPQQPATAAQGVLQQQQQHQHQQPQTGGQLGAHVAQAVEFAAPGGHFNLIHHPDADMDVMVLLPSSVPPEVLRPLTNPSVRQFAPHCLTPSGPWLPILISYPTPPTTLFSPALSLAHTCDSRCCAHLAIGGTACVHFADSLRDAQRQI